MDRVPFTIYSWKAKLNSLLIAVSTNRVTFLKSSSCQVQLLIGIRVPTKARASGDTLQHLVKMDAQPVWERRQWSSWQVSERCQETIAYKSKTSKGVGVHELKINFFRALWAYPTTSQAGRHAIDLCVRISLMVANMYIQNGALVRGTSIYPTLSKVLTTLLRKSVGTLKFHILKLLAHIQGAL